MKEQADQTFIREAQSYIQSLMIAEHLAGRAFAKGENAAHDARASLVFLAFTIEAFCNHVGYKLAPDFAEFDKLRANDKLAVRRSSSVSPCHWADVPSKLSETSSVSEMRWRIPARKKCKPAERFLVQQRTSPLTCQSHHRPNGKRIARPSCSLVRLQM